MIAVRMGVDWKRASWHALIDGQSATLCGRALRIPRERRETFRGHEKTCESCLRIAQRRGLVFVPDTAERTEPA